MKRMIYLLTALMLISTAIAQTNQTNQTTTTQTGPTIDEHGCITSAGFVWCALREKCIRPWEEPCDDGRAVPLNSSNTTTTTSIPTTTTTLVIVNDTTTTQPALAPTTSSSETTLVSPTTTTEVMPILISEPVNETNQTEQNTTETTISTTTIPQISEPTTTVAPICGNMYQEVGEQCDTTASPCGAGRWQCIDCNCVPLPEETTTTTIKSLNLTAAGISLNVPSSIDTKLVVGGFFALLAVIVLILYLVGGKDEKEETKKP